MAVRVPEIGEAVAETGIEKPAVAVAEAAVKPTEVAPTLPAEGAEAEEIAEDAEIVEGEATVVAGKEMPVVEEKVKRMV